MVFAFNRSSSSARTSKHVAKACSSETEMRSNGLTKVVFKNFHCLLLWSGGLKSSRLELSNEKLIPRWKQCNNNDDDGKLSKVNLVVFGVSFVSRLGLISRHLSPFEGVPFIIDPGDILDSSAGDALDRPTRNVLGRIIGPHRR